MTLTVKLTLIVTLILSIILPFGYYLIGEKNKKALQKGNRRQYLLLLWRFCNCRYYDVWRFCSGC